MDPRKTECFNLYLYGAGYFARDENTLGLLTGGETDNTHFCLSCPRRADCEAQQHRRVREQQPAAVERYERAIRLARRQGFSDMLAAFALAQKGANPYFADAMENFRRGHADRGGLSGTLTQAQQAE